MSRPVPLKYRLTKALIWMTATSPVMILDGKLTGIRACLEPETEFSWLLCAAGRFRNDLYFRLRVVTLRIPPLRERGRDVLRLAAAFLDRDARTENRRFRGFSPDATAALQAHDWPGNVRDLEHRIRRAVLFAAGEEITAADLELAPAAVGAPPDAARAGGLRALVERTERDALDAALRASDGNVAAAARALGIGRSTLQDLMKRHELSRKGVRGEG